MRFDPKSEEEINAMRLLPDGDYDVEVTGAEEQISSKGNEMIKLSLRVYRADGEPHPGTIFDYLISMDSMIYKVRQAAEGFGLLDKYKSGAFEASDFMERTGRVTLTTKKGTGTYQDSNAVKAYLKPAGGASSVPSRHAVTTVDFSDDIPF